MNTITRFIVQIWKSIPSIFGMVAEKSEKPETAAFTRAIIIGIRSAGGLHSCEIVPHREDKGRYQCAILWQDGCPSLKPRTLQQIAEFVARDYFHRGPDTVTWICIPHGSAKQPVTPENVLELQFAPRGADGEFRFSWSEAAPALVSEWIERTAATREFGRHILVR